MALSYSLRVACVIALSLGLLQIIFEVLLRLTAPLVLRFLALLPLREQERALYLVQLTPVALAILLTACSLLPHYISNESNIAAERVGWFCLPFAAGLYIWWTAKILHGIRMAVCTTLYSRACHLNASSAPSQHPPVITVVTSTPRVALVGLLRPFISISKSLLEVGGLAPNALEIVFDHERSHAAQRDNWKLFILHCLPRLDPRLPHGRTWMQLWQSAAECAADEDAVAGSHDRAMLLAETLIALARVSQVTRPEVVSTYLVCDDTDLAIRIDHLLQTSPARKYLSVIKLAAVGCSVALPSIVSLAILTFILRNLPEHLLHLG